MDHLLIILDRTVPAEGHIVAGLEAVGATDIRIFAAFGLVTCRAEAAAIGAIGKLEFVAQVRPDRAVSIPRDAD